MPRTEPILSESLLVDLLRLLHEKTDCGQEAHYRECERLARALWGEEAPKRLEAIMLAAEREAGRDSRRFGGGEGERLRLQPPDVAVEPRRLRERFEKLLAAPDRFEQPLRLVGCESVFARAPDKNRRAFDEVEVRFAQPTDESAAFASQASARISGYGPSAHG